MSRLTLGNVVKVTLVVLFFYFVVLLVLLIGIRRKKPKVILEGALYVALFIAAFSIPSDSGFSTAAAFIGLGTMAVSAVRGYMLRDLWLHRRGRGRQPDITVQANVPSQPVDPSYAAPTVPARDDLSSALAWVASLAKHSKNQLPADAYVIVLETCQTLDAVIDAETRQPSGDARFEYELAAVVREYLPAVLRGYLAIPPSMVGNRQPNGRTPNEELVEQLQLLSGQAEALHSSRHSHTSAELTSTGNFLRERFGHHQRDGFDFGIK
ncbi:hypothetical protein MUG94_01240 [Arthrobacter gengyunqii]|uniref:Uncharacterized protein n=1 Tax=Arthrobacter gengyunqii TaxID=2886940 RepID=A0A9X1M5T9_9MICC|nr:hypothetical protein [Arthrobacter gengyunqii]MCC3270859.1 hypothetical protein [Arthrobacter gengyunqii]UOY96450.1 hypothetical protein MUG94_01240 [Arthrobacter gengyunqii]